MDGRKVKKLFLLAILVCLLVGWSQGHAADVQVTFAWSQDLSTYTFSWYAVEGAVKYTLKVHEAGTPVDCTTMTFCGDVVGLSKVLVLKPGTVYDWTVAPVMADGTTGQAGSATFTAGLFTGWKLYKSSTSGGPYTFHSTIPIMPPVAEYQSVQKVTVPDGVKTTLYFVLTLFDEAYETAYSNEAVGVFDIPVPIAPNPPSGLRLVPN